MASAGTTPAGSFQVPPPAAPFGSLPASMFQGGNWFRVHQFNAATGKYVADAFNATSNGNGRFSPLIDPATNTVVPTIYAALTPAGAIAEVVLHDVPMLSTGHVHDWERDKASDLHLGEIALPQLKLIDLTSMGLRRVGLYVHDLFGTESVDYPRTRGWALHIWQNYKDAQGLYWMSVRENGCPAVMVFGDRLGSLVLKDLNNSQPIRNYEDVVFELLWRLGASIAPA